VAQDNVFNKAVLENNGYYFNTAAEVQQYADSLAKDSSVTALLNANTCKIEQSYSWARIIDAYESFFLRCHREKKTAQNPLSAVLRPTKQPG
jgi:hypothetical protein